MKDLKMCHNDEIDYGVKGTLIVRECGRTILRKDNAIHRHNLNQIIVRALSGRKNSGIARMGFGSGGTVIDATYNVLHRSPNVGNPPHDNTGWASRMYNESYSKLVDVEDIEIEEDDEKSRLIISVKLNNDEPQGQLISDNVEPNTFIRNEFTFDEISLFSGGLGPISTGGSHSIFLPDYNADDLSGLETSTRYYIMIDIGDGKEMASFLTRSRGSSSNDELTYRDIVTDFNNQIGVEYNIRLSITDEENGIFNNNELKFENLRTGSESMIEVSNPDDGQEYRRFIDSLVGTEDFLEPVRGTNAGVRNSKNDPETERERLLTHITFDPILKSNNRSLEIEYIIEFT